MADVFGIETLKSKIGGFAKGNRYNVTFAGLPTGLSTAVNENLQYLCESVSLPTKGIASNAHDIYGLQEKYLTEKHLQKLHYHLL